MILVIGASVCLSIDVGAYPPTLVARFLLSKAADAHEAQDSGRVVGEILVDLPTFWGEPSVIE